MAPPTTKVPPFGMNSKASGIHSPCILLTLVSIENSFAAISLMFCSGSRWLSIPSSISRCKLFERSSGLIWKPSTSAICLYWCSSARSASVSPPSAAGRGRMTCSFQAAPDVPLLALLPLPRLRRLRRLLVDRAHKLGDLALQLAPHLADDLPAAHLGGSGEGRGLPSGSLT